MRKILDVGSVDEKWDAFLEENNKAFLDYGLVVNHKIQTIIVGDYIFEGKDIIKNIEKIFEMRKAYNSFIIIAKYKNSKKTDIARVSTNCILQTFKIFSASNLIPDSDNWK